MRTDYDVEMPLDYTPRAGDRHTFLTSGYGDPWEVEVVRLDGDTVVVAERWGAQLGREARIPLASFPLFINDLRAFVVADPSGDPYVDTVLAGDAQFLGKGNDGLAFRVGAAVVKVSTTVPYQPMNPGHLTPAEAVARMVEQHRVGEAMRSDGVPGILPTELVVHGGRAFLLRRYIEIPERLTSAQLDAVRESVYAAHHAGWVFRDDLQVGVFNGRVFHYDTGAAGRAMPLHAEQYAHHSDEASDIARLQYLYRAHGESLLTPNQETLFDDVWEATLRADKRTLLQLHARLNTFKREHPSVWTAQGGQEYAAKVAEALTKLGAK